MQIHIRKATPSDLQQITQCAEQAYAIYIDRMKIHPAPMHADFGKQINGGFIWVALADDRFAGYVVFYPQGDDHLHLENLAVVPSFQGHGIGKALIEHVETSAQQSQLGAVELYTNEAMTENLLMYPELGYLEIERKQQDGFNRVFFRKEIACSKT